jgi:hypothetical protein
VVAGPLRARPVYSSIIRAFGAKLILLFGSLALTFPIAEVGFRIFDYRGFHVDRERDWKEALVPASDPRRIPKLKIQFNPNSQFRMIYGG